MPHEIIKIDINKIIKQSGGNHKMLFTEPMSVYLSYAKYTDLINVGTDEQSSVSNMVYKDYGINGIVKFVKEINKKKTLLEAIIRPKPDEYNEVLFDSIITKNDYDKLLLINGLKSFSHVTGYVIYPNIAIRALYANQQVAKSFVYEYLNNVASGWEMNEENKNNIVQILADFRTLNLNNYVYGKKYVCEHIIKCEQGLKVIGVDSIRKVNDNIQLSNIKPQLLDIVQDIRGLTNCLIQVKILPAETLDELDSKIASLIYDVLKSIPVQSAYRIHELPTKVLRVPLNEPNKDLNKLKSDSSYSRTIYLDMSLISPEIDLFINEVYDNYIKIVDTFDYKSIAKGSADGVLARKTKMLFDKPMPIYVSGMEFPNLSYIGSGVPNAVYKDNEINGVVKFSKNASDTQALFWKNHKPDFDIYDSMPYNTIITKKNMDTIAFVNNLPSFLHATGYIIYPNILTGYNRESLRVASSVVYEYLNNGNDEWDNYASNDILNILSDFKTLNVNGYIHGDLQSMCRNIMKYDKGLKVVDVDGIDKEDDKVTLSMITPKSLRLFKDIYGITNCLIHLKILPENAIEQLYIRLNKCIDNIYELMPAEKYYDVVDLPKRPWVAYNNVHKSFTKDDAKMSRNSQYYALDVLSVLEIIVPDIKTIYDEYIAIVSGQSKSKKYVLVK